MEVHGDGSDGFFLFVVLSKEFSGLVAVTKNVVGNDHTAVKWGRTVRTVPMDRLVILIRKLVFKEVKPDFNQSIV
jgi:hypothetical protein